MDQVSLYNNSTTPVRNIDSSESASSIAGRDSNGDSRFRKQTSALQNISEGSDAIGVASAQTGNFTADTTKGTWPIDNSGGNAAGTLPAASGVQQGTKLTFIRITATSNTCVVKPAGSDTINGSDSSSPQSLGSQWSKITVQRISSSAWYIVA